MVRVIKYKPLSKELNDMFKPNDASKIRASVGLDQVIGEFTFLTIENLIPFKNQARKIFDEASIQELASTIKKHGIRQPLTVLPSSHIDGKYEIISGERRLRAAKSLGLTKVPCIIVHDESVADELAIIENVQRKDLHPLELMTALQVLIDKKICHNTQEVAAKIGIHKSKVIETMALNDLSPDIKILLLKHEIKSRAILRSLVKCKTKPEEQIQIIDSFLNRNTEEKKKSNNSNKLKILTVYMDKEKITVEYANMNNITQKDLNEIIQQIYQIIGRHGDQ